MQQYLPLLLILVAMGGMIYFLMIRPLRTREKQHDKMVALLEPGDEVITAAGIYGEIESIDESSVILIVESGAKIRVTKGAVLKRNE